MDEIISVGVTAFLLSLIGLLIGFFLLQIQKT